MGTLPGLMMVTASADEDYGPCKIPVLYFSGRSRRYQSVLVTVTDTDPSLREDEFFA